MNGHTLLLHVHSAHTVLNTWHSFIHSEVLLRLSKLRRLLCTHWAWEVICPSHHVRLRGFYLVHTQMTHYKLFDARVEHGLSHLINLELNDLSSIIIFVHGSHPFPVFQLTYVYGESSHPLNVFLDLFSIIESFLLYCLFLDLFEDPQLRHYLGVHAVEICRSSDTLTGPLALC
jgi:hypothetical protein